jgi:hypothetical protein
MEGKVFFWIQVLPLPPRFSHFNAFPVSRQAEITATRTTRFVP